MAQRPEVSDEIQRHAAKLGKDPTSRVFAQLADAYRKEGLFEEAIRICRDGLTVHPTYAAARVVLGRALMEHGSLEEADAELRLALQHVPDNPLALRLLGDIAVQRDQPSEAREYYTRALRANPRDAEIQERLAALTDSARAEEESPGEPSADYFPLDRRGPEAIAAPIASSEGMPVEARIRDALEPGPAVAATEPARAGMSDRGDVFEEPPSHDPQPPASASPDPLASPTLAALYASQGFPDVAAAISAQLDVAPDRSVPRVEGERAQAGLPHEILLGSLSSLREAVRQSRRARSTERKVRQTHDH